MLKEIIYLHIYFDDNAWSRSTWNLTVREVQALLLFNTIQDCYMTHTAVDNVYKEGHIIYFNILLHWITVWFPGTVSDVQFLVGLVESYVYYVVTSTISFVFDNDPITSKFVVEIIFINKNDNTTEQSTSMTRTCTYKTASGNWAHVHVIWALITVTNPLRHIAHTC
jgi:hypothetical protein